MRETAAGTRRVFFTPPRIGLAATLLLALYHPRARPLEMRFAGLLVIGKSNYLQRHVAVLAPRHVRPLGAQHPQRAAEAGAGGFWRSSATCRFMGSPPLWGWDGVVTISLPPFYAAF